MNPLRKFVRGCGIGTLTSLLTALLMSLQPISTCAQRLYDFNSPAAEAGHAIEKAAKGSERPVLLATDFSEESRPGSELGIALARDFADALRARAEGFIVLDGSDAEASVHFYQGGLRVLLQIGED